MNDHVRTEDGVNYITFDFMTAWRNFPIYNNLPSEIVKVKKGIPGTTCCMQLSYALNATGMKVPDHSWRRKLPKGESGNYYFLAPDEVALWLNETFFTGINLKEVAGSSLSDMKKYLDDRWGILTFYEDVYPLGPVAHTELWKQTTIKQNADCPTNMSEAHIFGNKTVLFWDFY